ncbi:hypothetical protein BJY04DRAFT_41472 [Aspergillus karnatakaensis]|uniref:uncharacterized protein n=1 Tax=Aspergillus karnatakaensis TaxID=1810916 RepID=UPI003CCD5C24
MPLTIHLDNHRPEYHGNEDIIGLVSLTTTTPFPLKQVLITFSGHAKTKIQKVKGVGAPASTYRSNVTLFEKQKVLLQLGGDVLAPGSYEWPFQFTFPTHEQGATTWAKLEPYRVDDNHPLPPTFAIETGDAARKLHCGIEYKLEAQVQKPQGGLFASKVPLYTEVVKLDFLNALTISNTIDLDPYATVYRQNKEQLCKVRSKLLLPNNRGRSLSMSEKLSSWFSSSQLPRFTYKVSFSYPTSLVQFAPYPCHLTVEAFMEDSNVTEMPEVVMRSVAVSMTSRTSARAVPTLVGAMSAEIDDKIEILNQTALSIPVSGKMDLGQVFGPLVMRKTDVSFSTFNICRSYRLNVAAVFECAGKQNEFKMEDVPIEVVARGVAGESDQKDAVFMENGVEDELPPVYTPSESTSPVEVPEKA